MSRLLFPFIPAAILLTASLAAAQPAAEPPKRLDQHGEPLPAEAIGRIGSTRLRHSWFLYASAFSPDGKLFAGGTVDSIMAWDAGTIQSRVQLKLNHHQVMPHRLLFSPDSTM